MNWGALGAAVHGVTKSRTQLIDFTFTFHFHALEKEMATHSSVLAWRIPGTVEPGGLPSIGLHRVGHYWSDLAELLKGFPRDSSCKESTCQGRRHKKTQVLSLSWVRKIPWRRAWQPTPVFLPGESHGQRSLLVTVHRVTKRWTWLKWLSTSTELLKVPLTFNPDILFALIQC